MRRKMLIVLALAALASIPAFGAQLSDTYVIPAAAHAVGAGGETWSTDISIFNPNGSTLSVDVQLIPASGAAASVVGNTITVPALSTLALHDVLGVPCIIAVCPPQPAVTGALIVAGNLPFALSARAIATTAAGTSAEAVTPASDFIDATGRDSFIAGLTANNSFRSNVGFFAAADASGPMTVTVTLLSATGSSLGSRSFTIPANGAMQVQLSTHDLSATTFDAASARISITSGNGILTSYGSVVDNRTSVGMFISGAGGVTPPTSTSSLLRSRYY